jgi:hypothetical protein
MDGAVNKISTDAEQRLPGKKEKTIKNHLCHVLAKAAASLTLNIHLQMKNWCM